MVTYIQDKHVSMHYLLPTKQQLTSTSEKHTPEQPLDNVGVIPMTGLGRIPVLRNFCLEERFPTTNGWEPVF